MRQRYDLAGPKLFIQHHYNTEVCKNVLGSKKVLSLLEKAFTEKHESVASEMTRTTCKRAIASIAAKRLVNRVQRLRKLYACFLSRSVRSITKIEITEKGDIGEGLHCAHSEPFFYESAYQYVDRPDSMNIDECGRYRPDVKSVSRRVIVSPEHGSVVGSANRSQTKKLVSYLISNLGLVHI